jgi:hypothetical protein
VLLAVLGGVICYQTAKLVSYVLEAGTDFSCEEHVPYLLTAVAHGVYFDLIGMSGSFHHLPVHEFPWPQLRARVRAEEVVVVGG